VVCTSSTTGTVADSFCTTTKPVSSQPCTQPTACYVSVRLKRGKAHSFLHNGIG
jgi:hypothetical protein